MKRLNRTKRNLFLSLGLLFSLATAAVTTTYAWFAVRQMDIQQTEFFSGELGINLVQATAYKYVYPVYPNTTLPNYDSLDAGVQTHNVTSVTNPLSSEGFLVLNKLDTTKIYLDNNASSEIDPSDLRDEIAKQNTSILIKIDFTTLNTESVGLSLFAKRDAPDNFDYENATNNFADTDLLASDFLCFSAFLDPNPSPEINTPKKIWDYFRSLYSGDDYDNRKYYHQDENSHGTDLTVHESNLAKMPSDNPVSHSLYLFMEYEPTHIASYLMNVERLRYSYHLENDFRFVLQLSSEVVS